MGGLQTELGLTSDAVHCQEDSRADSPCTCGPSLQTAATATSLRTLPGPWLRKWQTWRQEVEGGSMLADVYRIPENVQGSIGQET